MKKTTGPKHQQRIPIPADWDGETWFCTQLQWPASPEWISVLVGILSNLTRGWYWNEQTGIVTDAQGIGRAIFSKNIGFTPCSENGGGGNGGNGGTTTPPSIGGMSSEDCEEEMTGITWLAVEDGQLYMYFGPCCKVAVEGDFASIIGDVPPDTNEDPDDPQTWACNKAYWIADTLVSVAGDVIDAISGLGSVYSMYSPAHGVLSQFGSTWQTTQLVCAAYVADATEIETMLTDPDLVAWLACGWSPLMAETDNLNSSEQYSMITTMPSKYTSGQQLFMRRMVQAMSLATLQWWARLFFDRVADCACPEDTGDSIPTASGWYWGAVQPEMTFNIPYNQGGAFPENEWGYPFNKIVVPHDVYGCQWRVSLVSGTVSAYKRSNDDQPWMGSFDHYFSGSNSDSLTPGTLYVQVNTDQFNELYPAGGATRIAPLTGDGSSVVASPVLTQGGIALMALSMHESAPAATSVARLSEFRWLHNTGSPSHS